jgi:hypothetical protein
MRAVVLAAGKGTRLSPLTREVSKPLAPVADTPIIEHIFDLLARHGIEEAYVNVHNLADALFEAYDGQESYINGVSVHLLREKELTGTAGGVKHLAKIAPKGSFNETFVVVSGGRPDRHRPKSAPRLPQAEGRSSPHSPKEGLRHLGIRGSRGRRGGHHPLLSGKTRPRRSRKHSSQHQPLGL